MTTTVKLTSLWAHDSQDSKGIVTGNTQVIYITEHPTPEAYASSINNDTRSDYRATLTEGPTDPDKTVTWTDYQRYF